MPALTRFYSGAIHPLNVEQYTTRELGEYVTQMDRYEAAEQEKQRRANGG